MKKNSIANQALLEMNDITSAIKEESKNTLKGLLSEAVKTAIRESVNEDDANPEEEDITIEDEQGAEPTGQAPMPQQGASMPQMQQQAPVPEEGAEEPVEGAEGAEPVEGEENPEWDEFEQYKSDDNTYDLSGVKDPEQVVKVFKLLKSDDNVVIKKEGSKIDLKDGDAEYVIDLGEEGVEGEEMPLEDEEAPEMPVETGEEGEEALNEGLLFEVVSDDEDDEILDDDEDESDEDEDDFLSGLDDDDVEFDQHDMDDDEIDDLIRRHEEDEDEYDYPLDPEEEGDEIAGIGISENKQRKKAMKEKQELVFEVDLGYTDNYQDKDPIAGLSMEEPSKSGRSWHKGLPLGTKKRWAGDSKSKGKPYGKTHLDEMDECGAAFCEEGGIEEGPARTSVKQCHRVKSAGKPKEGFPVRAPHAGAEELEEIKSENEALKEAVLKLRKSLNESYVTNVNLGQITKLFLENTTSQAEKTEIVNRFANEAKTVEQSKRLFESINKNLKKVVKPTKSLNESKVAPKQVIKENTYKSNDLMKTLDLIKRVENI